MNTKLLKKLRKEAKKRYVIKKNDRFDEYRLVDTSDGQVLKECDRFFGFDYIKQRCKETRRNYILRIAREKDFSWRTLKY